MKIGLIDVNRASQEPHMDNLIIDGFCGGGGASVGIQMSTGREVDIAINHDMASILMHKTNHPKTKHLKEDIFKVNLQKYTKGRHVALMWMSPDCFPAGNLVWTDWDINSSSTGSTNTTAKE